MTVQSTRGWNNSDGEVALLVSRLEWITQSCPLHDMLSSSGAVRRKAVGRRTTREDALKASATSLGEREKNN